MPTFVLSLGGSLIVPQKIDVAFLRRFRDFILGQKDKKFIIVCGGGYINKMYNQAARQLSRVSDQELDWIGIKATELNAQLIRTLFSKIAYQNFIKPIQKIKTQKRVIVCGGWKPGWSSDYDAVLLAKNFNAKKVINLTNINYVYDKDPKKYRGARPLEKISWGEYRKIVGSKWIPRLHTPFDPIAAKLAQRLKLKAVILNGRNLENLGRCLNGKKFKGTIIQ